MLVFDFRHFSFPCCFQRLYAAAKVGLHIQHVVVDAGIDPAASRRLRELGGSLDVSWSVVSALIELSYIENFFMFR